MPQITNNALNESVNRIEERVRKLETRMDDNDTVIKAMKNSLDALVGEFKSARTVLGLVGAIVTPVLTATIVLIIQHLWGK